MTRTLTVGLLGFFLSSLTTYADEKPIYHPQSVEVYFSPDGGVTDAIVSVIEKAKKTIHVQAYSFTSAPIAKALVEAHKRGVTVSVILDKSQKTEKYSSADFLSHAGISVSIDSKHAIAHSKIIIVDEEIVITGSFNFTKSAEERNSENLVIIRDENLAQEYLLNWVSHKEHSAFYSPR